MASRAAVILADGFEEIEAVTIIDILRRGGVDVVVAGLQSTTVRGAHALTFIADTAFSDLGDEFDAIVLPGGQPGTRNLGASERLLRKIRAACDAGKLCAAVCAAPTVLARAGVLEGRAATCYPGFEDQLSGAVLSEKTVVCDGNVITSRAVGTAIEFALAVVAYLVSEDMADDVASKILYKRA